MGHRAAVAAAARGEVKKLMFMRDGIKEGE